MKSNKLKQIPPLLREIPGAPRQLYYSGADPALFTGRHCLAIIGSRKVSTYGRQITLQLAGELAARGIVITSGLALGVDGLAHEAALEAGGTTIAVLPSSIECLAPVTHFGLAERIVAHGGTLISEYAPGTETQKSFFVERNRLVSGLSQAILITEAAEKSGTLHTARFALEQGREVLVVPGNITSPTSRGTNNLLRAGATPVTSAKDVLEALGMEAASATSPIGDTPQEQCLLNLMQQGIAKGTDLQTASELSVSEFNQALVMLELAAKIRPLGANQWALK